MQDNNLNCNESLERDDANELEPVVLAPVTEVTRGDSFGGGDGDNIVWGYF